VIDKRLKYKEGGPMKKIKGQDHMLAYITPGERNTLVSLGGQETMTSEGIPAYPPSENYGGNHGSGKSSNTGGGGRPNMADVAGPVTTSTPKDTSPKDTSDSRSNYISTMYNNMPTPTVTIGVDKFDNPININTTYTEKAKRAANLAALNAKGISSFDPRVQKIGINPFGFDVKKPKKKPGFFNSGIGKIIKTIGLGIVAPQLLAGTKLGTAYNAYNSINRINNLVNSLGITDINVIDSLKSNLTSPKSKKSTKTGPKDPPREGGDGDNQQNALMSEYMLLLKKMEQGILQKEEKRRFNSLKSRLGKARGGRMNDEVRKKSEVIQFTPPPEKTGILQKLFGIDTDKLYDQGFDSMNKYRERNPNNPREVLQTAGGKLSNLRHGVSTSLLRDAILKKINPGSYEMKEAPPSMNFKELKMSEEGPNKAAKGVASLLAYLGAGANEIGPEFFSQETREDLTANLLGLMKTDVYDTPDDKAAMLNDILENDTGGINTYLQSLAPKEKYQEDAMLFPPMRQDKMRDQDLLFMKAEEDYEDKVKNLGLGAMDG